MRESLRENYLLGAAALSVLLHSSCYGAGIQASLEA